MMREPEIICLDGEVAAKLCAGVLVDRSAWFEMTPLPDNKFEFKFKSGEGHLEVILLKMARP